MTIDELRDLIADLPGDAEVKVVHQPGWPLMSDVEGTCYDGTFWIGAEGNTDYAPGEVTDAMGWGR